MGHSILNTRNPIYGHILIDYLDHVLTVLLFTSVPQNGQSDQSEESVTAIETKMKPEKQKLPEQPEPTADLSTKKKKRKLANDSGSSGNRKRVFDR